MIRNFFNYVVSNFGFEDISDFSNSLLHTKLLTLTIPFAGLSAIAETYFGLQSLTIFAFVLLVTLELITGLTAAKVSKTKIESKKFGRFGLKIFVWISLLFIINSFRLEFKTHEDMMGNLAFGLLNWLHGTLFIYVCLEYLISVLENMGTISGKDNKGIIDNIRIKLKSFMGNGKNKKEDNEN
jgi:hypothetical protein